MSWDKDLTGSAYRIAASDESPFRVMAGPGTGKTYAMMRRIARLLEEGINPKKILAVTFTRAAASMLLDELCKIGVEGCESITATTLHKFCMSILMKHRVIQKLSRHPRMLTSYLDKKIYKFECAPMISDVMCCNFFGTRRKNISKMIRLYEAAWASLQSQTPGWPTDPTEKQFNGILVDWLRFHKAMLIGEMVPMALKYLMDNPAFPEGKRFDYVVVDEYQDLNKADQTVIEYMSQGKQTLIVGDVNQSIYSFRYANPEGIVEYHRGDPNVKDEPLATCRRCSKAVVAVANKLIKHNYPDQDVEILEPFPKQKDGEVTIVHWKSLFQEIEGIGQYIIKLKQTANAKDGDFLILTPRRKIAYLLQDYLKFLEIESRCFYQEEYIDNDYVQLAITKLRLLFNKYDRVSLRFWLGQNSNNHNAIQYGKLRAYCAANVIEPYDLLLSLHEGNVNVNSKYDKLLALFYDLLHELKHMETLPIDELINYLFPEDEDWTKRIREYLSYSIEEITEIDELVNWVNNLTQPEMPSDGNFVRIMSFHKSKGLKSRFVVLMTCLEGLIPVYDNDLSGEELDRHFQEQRRVFYVGMTRCEENLVVSYCHSMPYKLIKTLNLPLGDDGYLIQSRFIRESKVSETVNIAGVKWLDYIK